MNGKSLLFVYYGNVVVLIYYIERNGVVGFYFDGFRFRKNEFYFVAGFYRFTDAYVFTV